MPNIGDFLNSVCVDLTPYLSGDAIKEYPNLANLVAPNGWRESGGKFTKDYETPEFKEAVVHHRAPTPPTRTSSRARCCHSIKLATAAPRSTWASAQQDFTRDANANPVQ
jgi:hypothetical protein